MPNYSLPELSKNGSKPLARWLVEVALNRDTLTYGEAGARLEKLLHLPNIFSVHIGSPAGYLMEHIHEVDEDVPLLNVLLVRQSDNLPGNGAATFMAKRFDVQRLANPYPRENYPKLWKTTSLKAAAEVYAYENWAQVFERTFEEKYEPDKFSPYTTQSANGESGDFGKGGESNEHKKLRLWVKENAAEVCKLGEPMRSSTEVVLKSADRVDVVYYFADRTVAVEVKSKLSSVLDLERGVFQCIKYRAVLEAMDPRPNSNIEGYLVTEENLPSYLIALCKLHKIKWYLKH